MSGDKFKKAQAGRPLEIPASTWNAMVDAARSNAESQHDQRGESDSLLRQGDIIKGSQPKRTGPGSIRGLRNRLAHHSSRGE